MKTKIKAILTKTSFIIISFCTASFDLHAELLIIKKNNGKWTNLDQSDIHNTSAIASVMQKYQWPMVINSKLTPQEADELLSPNEPYAEERFIAKKLQEINPDYDVMFIPTCIYELFAITHQKMWNTETTFIHIEPILNNAPTIGGVSGKFIIQQQTMQKINHHIAAHNDKHYQQDFFNLNNALVTILFDEYKSLSHVHNGLTISQQLKPHIREFAVQWIQKKLNEPIDNNSQYQEALNNELTHPNADIQTLRADRIISPVIELEYQARKENKAILLRGYNPTTINDTQGNPLKISTSTLKINPNRVDHIYPYSISFGNSLFAGYLYDKVACSFSYMNNSQQGMGLFINKKDYYQHPVNELFLISPLGTLSALTGRGEWFHSRTKAIITSQSKALDQILVSGLFSSELKDPAQIFLIEQDPVKFAQKYAQYVQKNGFTIQPTKITNQSDKFNYNQYGYLHPEFVNSQKITQDIITRQTIPMRENQGKFINILDPYSKTSKYKPIFTDTTSDIIIEPSYNFRSLISPSKNTSNSYRPIFTDTMVPVASSTNTINSSVPQLNIPLKIPTSQQTKLFTATSKILNYL